VEVTLWKEKRSVSCGHIYTAGGGLITGSSSSLEKKGWFLPLGGALARLKVGVVKKEIPEKGGRLNKLSFLSGAFGVSTPEAWGSKLKKGGGEYGERNREGGGERGQLLFFFLFYASF